MVTSTTQDMMVRQILAMASRAPNMDRKGNCDCVVTVDLQRIKQLDWRLKGVHGCLSLDGF